MIRSELGSKAVMPSDEGEVCSISAVGGWLEDGSEKGSLCKEVIVSGEVLELEFDGDEDGEEDEDDEEVEDDVVMKVDDEDFNLELFEEFERVFI